MASLQGGVYAFVLICPIHFALVMANLLYIHYFNVVDHSGIYLESRFPWQARHPSSTSSSPQQVLLHSRPWKKAHA
jgi:hypothetical protein